MNSPFRRIRTIYENTRSSLGGLEHVSFADVMMIGMFFLFSPIFAPMIFLGLVPFFVMDVIDLVTEYVRQNRRNRTDTSDSRNT